jgi:hypothetical protein
LSKLEAEKLRAAFFGNPVLVYLYENLEKVVLQAVIEEVTHSLQSVDRDLGKRLEGHMAGPQVTQ